MNKFALLFSYLSRYAHLHSGAELCGSYSSITSLFNLNLLYSLPYFVVTLGTRPACSPPFRRRCILFSPAHYSSMQLSSFYSCISFHTLNPNQQVCLIITLSLCACIAIPANIKLASSSTGPKRIDATTLFVRLYPRPFSYILFRQVQ